MAIIIPTVVIIRSVVKTFFASFFSKEVVKALFATLLVKFFTFITIIIVMRFCSLRRVVEVIFLRTFRFGPRRVPAFFGK